MTPKSSKLSIFNAAIAATLIMLVSGCSSGISGKYADLKKPNSVIELKSDNTFYVTKKEADGKTSILKGEYSIKDNYLYTDKILTLDGKDVPSNMSDTVVAASHAHPMKIEGSTLVYDKESVYTKQDSSFQPSTLTENSASSKESNSIDKGLLEAAKKCDYELANILLNKGANPGALVQSSLAGDKPFTPFLASVGQVIEKKSQSYRTAKEREACDKVFKLLLSHKPDLNIVVGGYDIYATQSPLHSLAKFPYNPKLIKILLEKGANSNVVTVEGTVAFREYLIGTTPLMIMASNPLIEDALDPKTKATVASRKDSTDVFKKNELLESFSLISKSSNIDIQDVKGNTALMYSVESKNIYIASKLLKLGAKADIRDENGKTVLDVATEHGDTEMVKLLSAKVN
jgi:Ankyrin repeats (3 copies)